MAICPEILFCRLHLLSLAQLQTEVPVCKSKFQSGEICKRKCQERAFKTGFSHTNLGVKFASLEISLANGLKRRCSVFSVRGRHLRAAESLYIVSLRDGFGMGLSLCVSRRTTKKERHLSMSFSCNSERRSGRSPALPYPPVRESKNIVVDVKLVFNPLHPALHE